VNSANVTDPVTGGQAINLRIDVVSSVQVISNPYDPQYGKFTGAVATVATKTRRDYDKFQLFHPEHPSPFARRDGSIMGLGAATHEPPSPAQCGKDRIVAITQSFGISLCSHASK